MKNSFVLIMLLIVINSTISSQEKSLTIKSGAGYYTDLLGWYDGPIMWLEGGYHLNTGYCLNARVSVASIDWSISEGAFAGYKTMAIRQMIDITFSKPVKLIGQHYIEPGLGFKIKREYNLVPDVSFFEDSGQTYLYANYSDIFYEIGFTICADYYYRFKSNFFIGLRTDTNVIWALGFEGLSVSPVFGFNF